jgi:hypothetical protein
LLRSDFNDFGPLSCTRDLLSAQGATLSYANNLLKNQNTAAADGVLAIVRTYYDKTALFFKGYSVGTYVQGDDTYQFQPTKTQADNGYTLTPGVFAEFALVNQFVSGIDNFRIRDGEALASTGGRSNSVVGEWIPAYLLARYAAFGVPQQFGTTKLSYTFSPELMVQYDHFDGGPKTAALFASRNDALRIGPQFLLIFKFDSAPAVGLDFLTRFALQITNHESWDQFTGKEYSWTATSVTYTFPPLKGWPNAPNFGLSASYGFGNSEATGNLTKQVKIGLAAKL